MNTTIDANLNNSNCIQSATNLTYVHYQNICTGKSYDVPMGSLDMAGILFVAVLVIGFGTFIYKNTKYL